MDGEKCKFKLPAKECKLEESTTLAVHTAHKYETDVYYIAEVKIV